MWNYVEPIKLQVKECCICLLVSADILVGIEVSLTDMKAHFVLLVAASCVASEHWVPSEAQRPETNNNSDPCHNSATCLLNLIAHCPALTAYFYSGPCYTALSVSTPCPPDR